MEIIEFDDNMLAKYNEGDSVFLYDDEFVNISITSDMNKQKSIREGTKKVGCYMLSEKDKQKINTKEPTLIYDGKTQVGIRLTAKGDL